MTGPRSFSFSKDGGSQVFAFSTNHDWSISSSETWCRVSPSSGTAANGDVSVNIIVDNNATYDTRSCTITIKANDLMETVTVNQEMGLGLIVSPISLELTNAAQSIEIEVQKNINYLVLIDDNCKSWIQNAGTRALSSEKVRFNIAANTSFDTREGSITFMQVDGTLKQSVTIRQSQTNGLFITTPDYRLSNEAHTLNVEIKANVEFEVYSQADWIKYVETRALKPSSIILSIEKNETYDNRTGVVIVKQTNGDLSGTITITQNQIDGLFVTPTEFNLNNEKQTIELAVKNNVNFRVVIPDDARNWISVQSNTQTRALSDDKVILSIAQNNSYDEREASLTIKQTDGSLAETVIIRQAFREGLILEQSDFELSNEQQSLLVNLKSNVDFEVSSNVSWITYVKTRTLTTNALEFSIQANTSNKYRTGNITISQKNGSNSTTVTIRQQPLPHLKTINATSVHLFDATLNGKLEVETASNITNGVWFLYSKTAQSLEPLIDKGAKLSAVLRDDGSFESAVSELSYNTTYYFVACAKVLNKVYYGEVLSFTTEDFQETVDLGLSVNWRGWNVGADNPFKEGDYYACGETSPKDDYSWFTYKFRISGNGPGDLIVSKYATGEFYTGGNEDNKTLLEKEDDAASVNLGGTWRIPTLKEWEELETQCTKTNIVINGVKGYLITSNVNGYKGNCIFIRTVGVYKGKTKENSTSSMHWAADIYNYYMGRTFGPSDGNWVTSGPYRCWGYPVRPVCDKKN